MDHRNKSRPAFSSAATLTIISVASLVGLLALVGFQTAYMPSLPDSCHKPAENHRVANAERRSEDAADDRHDLTADHQNCEQDPPFDVAAWVRVMAETELSFPSMRQEGFESERKTADGNSLGDVDNDESVHWAFGPLRNVPIPRVAEIAWVRNPIDSFVLAKLEERGLEPTPQASRQVLGRRLWFALGLSPPVGPITAFVGDDREEAYEQLVDRLLADPGFGERWGRTWLDLARYADSNGYEEDELRPYAFTYRDFVISAANGDLGFDRFARWQIAGDELAPNNPFAVAATGFLTAAPFNTFLPQESERRDELDDIVSTIGLSMLGLTIGCARCHDHMYDPVSTTDYYRMIAVFEKTKRTHRFLAVDGGRDYEKRAAPLEERRQRIREMRIQRIVEDRLAKLDFTETEKNLIRQPIDADNQEQRRLLSQCMRCLMIDPSDLVGDFEPVPEELEEYERLKQEIPAIAATLPPAPPKGLTICGSEVARTHVLNGGDLRRKRQEVGPGFVTALTAGSPQWSRDAWKAWAPHNGQPRPRTALANWLTDTRRGAGVLFARVAVNRVWQHHFGHGLVRTPNDFGSHGDLPTHPELLEWLARELVVSDWSLKRIHRLIVTSATYRQGATQSTEALAADPGNRLFGRRQPQRLTAEMFRDALMQAGDMLNRDMHGPPVIPPIPREAIFQTQKSKEETWPAEAADSPNVARRAIYMLTKRTIPIPLLQLFDAPEGSFPCGQRKTTTVPTQVLAILNNPFVREQASKLALRAGRDDFVGGVRSDEHWLREVYLYALARLPCAEEEKIALPFLQGASRTSGTTDQRQRRVDYCHALIMSNAFLYID